ncbi:MAG: serine/threonine-protein kinase [Dehalococcoidia bacterium]
MVTEKAGWPKQIGRFPVEGPIGSGASATVCLARDPDLSRDVALKVMRSSYKDITDGSYKRFLREAKIAASLRHPNIVDIYDYASYQNGAGDQFAYMVMEYLPRTLNDLLKEHGSKLPPELAVVITQQVISGLSYAHAGTGRVVHRDLKPENILIGADGTPKITDFGIAHADQQTTIRTAVGDATVIEGTLEYMAPEQALDRQTDPRTDVFSLGVVLCKLLTGHTPLQDLMTTEAVVNHHRAHQAMPYADLLRAARVPKPLQRVVARALEIPPELRYQSVEEMGRALDRYHGSVLTRIKRYSPYIGIGSTAATIVSSAMIVGAILLWPDPPVVENGPPLTACIAAHAMGVAVNGVAYPPGGNVSLPAPEGESLVRVRLLLSKTPEDCSGELSLAWEPNVTLQNGKQVQLPPVFSRGEPAELVIPADTAQVFLAANGSLDSGPSQHVIGSAITIGFAGG